MHTHVGTATRVCLPRYVLVVLCIHSLTRTMGKHNEEKTVSVTDWGSTRGCLSFSSWHTSMGDVPMYT
jgi:hypothetical protein